MLNPVCVQLHKIKTGKKEMKCSCIINRLPVIPQTGYLKGEKTFTYPHPGTLAQFLKIRDLYKHKAF